MSRYSLISSAHRELVKSPHYELETGGLTFGTGIYTILADVGAPGWPEFLGAWNGFGTALGRPTYLTAVFTATSLLGGSRTFTVTVNRYNNSVVSDDMNGAGGTFPDDSNVASLFGILSTMGTAISATVRQYDDGMGNSATLALSIPFTLQDMRDNCHVLLASADFSPTQVDQAIQLIYAAGPSVPGLFPTLYSPTDGNYVWGWGVGGDRSFLDPRTDRPLIFGSVAPSIISYISGVSYLTPAAVSGYQQNFNWHMQKSMIVKPPSRKMFFEDDLGGGMGPPFDSTALYTVDVDEAGRYIMTPPLTPTTSTGTPLNIDIPADLTKASYFGQRTFLHFGAIP